MVKLNPHILNFWTYVWPFLAVFAPEKGGAKKPAHRDLSIVKVSGQSDGIEACFGRFFDGEVSENGLATFRRIRTNVPGSPRIDIRSAKILGRLS